MPLSPVRVLPLLCAACIPEEPLDDSAPHSVPTDTAPADTSPPADTGSPPLPTISTLEIADCDEGAEFENLVRSGPGEERNWVSQTLQADVAGTLSSIRYALYEKDSSAGAGRGLNCRAGLPHNIAIWTQSVGVPAANNPYWNITVHHQDVTPNAGAVEFEVPLPTELRVEAGEYVVVAFQQTGTWTQNVDGGWDGEVYCHMSCNLQGGNQSYWSVTDEAPFEWVPLATWDIDDIYLEVDILAD